MANSRLTVGRLGLEVATNSEVDPYPGITWDGDRLSFSGMLKADTTNGGAVLRQQLNGYGPNNTDEPIVAVTWSGDETVSGYYFPLSTEVQADEGSYVGDGWWFPFQAELVRVDGGYQAMTVEVITNQQLRYNEHAIVNASNFGWAAAPAAASGFAVNVASLNRNSLTLGSGSTLYLYDGTNVGNWSTVTEYSYRVPAASFYAGAARFELGTSPLNATNGMAVVVGDQTVNSPTGWRLNNDLIRVYPTSATASNFTVSIYDGSNWDAKTWTPTVYANGTNYSLGIPQSSTVLANRPDAVSVRLGYELYGMVSFPVGPDTRSLPGLNVYMDLTVRRGMRYVECAIFTANGSLGAVANPGIYRTNAEAGTAVTGGIEATSADAGGNKYRIYTGDGKTDDLTQGGFREDLTADVDFGTFAFGIGSDLSPGIGRYYFNSAETHQGVVGI